MFEQPAPSVRESLLLRQVLVVDDDPLVARAMKSLISRAGFHPIVCTSGMEALAESHRDIAAAILDIHLPDINGLDLAQQMRTNLGATTPIVILSGDNSIETIRALPDAGATYFFAKPVNGNRLVEQLKEWISAA